MKHQRAEPADAGDDVHSLPHQVRRVHLRAHIAGADHVDQLLERDRGEHQVVRVHLDGDSHVVGAGQGVDVGPELRGDVPLVVQDVHVDPVPGVDHPGRVARVGVRAGSARHRDNVLHPEQPGQLDRAAQVVGVLRADTGQRIERVAIAVQPGQLHAPGGELTEVVRAGLLGGQQQVEMAVRRRDEPAGVDLHGGQAVALQHFQGVGEGAVVQAGGVGAELESHRRWPSG